MKSINTNRKLDELRLNFYLKAVKISPMHRAWTRLREPIDTVDRNVLENVASVIREQMSMTR